MREQHHHQDLEDQTVVCVDCQQTFVFTSGERQFYLSKQLTVPPRRCPECRRLRRATLNPDPSTNLEATLRRAREEFRRW